MRDKTKAIYSHIHCVTKVLDPQSFMKEIPKIAQQCYEDDLIPKVMSTNGIPTMQDDGAHHKAHGTKLPACLRATSPCR